MPSSDEVPELGDTFFTAPILTYPGEDLIATVQAARHDHYDICVCGHGLGWHVGPNGVGLGSGPACHCGCDCFCLRCPLPVGTRVRMTRKFRKKMRWSGWKYHGVHSGKAHIREFGRCIGTVEGWMDYNSVSAGHPLYSFEKVGPEINVRWWSRGSTHGLRYMYDVEDLEVVKWAS